MRLADYTGALLKTLTGVSNVKRQTSSEIVFKKEHVQNCGVLFRVEYVL
jgi:hypothetical protein